MSRLAPRALPLAIAGTLLVTACTPTSPAQISAPDGIKQLSHSKTIPVGEGPHGIALAGGIIVNSNPKSGTISLIDPASDAVVKTLEFEGGKTTNSPTQAQATHDGLYAVTMDSKAHVLRVIKGSSQSVVGTVALGKAPGSKLAWVDDTTAYLAVGTAADANVVKVAWPNGFEAAAATESLTVRRPGATAFTAGFLAVKGGFLAVPNGPDNAVSLVKPGTADSLVTLQEGNNPGPIGISTLDGGAVLLYGNKNSNTVVLHDLNAKQTLATLPVGSTPTDMVLRADGRFAYVTCAGSGEVAIVDVANRKVHSQIKVGKGVAGTPAKPVHLYAVRKPGQAAAEEIWIGGDGDGSVTVLDAETQQAIAVVTVGAGHHKMAFTDAKAFVSNLSENTVSVVDRTALK